MILVCKEDDTQIDKMIKMGNLEKYLTRDLIDHQNVSVDLMNCWNSRQMSKCLIHFFLPSSSQRSALLLGWTGLTGQHTASSTGGAGNTNPPEDAMAPHSWWTKHRRALTHNDSHDTRAETVKKDCFSVRLTGHMKMTDSNWKNVSYLSCLCYNI